jgi:hypothetical protein
VVRELGEVLSFDVIDSHRFVRAALSVPGATRFAGTGDKPPRRWSRIMRAASERHSVERGEATQSRSGVRGFRIGSESRDSIAGLFDPFRRPRAWYVYHWWVYSDDAMLVSCYDWNGGPNFAHPSLERWVRELESVGVIECLGTFTFTQEWYDRVDRG